MRLSMAADLASPVSNSADRGLDERGVAVGPRAAHDLGGPVGFVAATAVANSMARP